MPESWEYASEEEWLEIQRKAFYQFLFGPQAIRQGISQAVGVEPPTLPPVQEEGGAGGLMGAIGGVAGAVGGGIMRGLETYQEHVVDPIVAEFSQAWKHPEYAIPFHRAPGELPAGEYWKGLVGQAEPGYQERVAAEVGQMPGGWRLAGSIGLDPAIVPGLGYFPKAARAVGLGGRGVRAATTLEDIMTGGPVLRAAGKPLAAIPAPARLPIAGTAIGAGVGYGVTGEPSGVLKGAGVGLAAGVGAEAGLAGLRGVGRAGARAVPEGMVATAAEKPGLRRELDDLLAIPAKERSKSQSRRISKLKGQLEEPYIPEEGIIEAEEMAGEAWEETARAVPERPGEVPPPKAAREAIEAAAAGAPPPREPPPTAAAGAPMPEEDPAVRLTRMLQISKPVRKEIAFLQHKARQQQAAILASIQKREPGIVGHFKQRGALKGELPGIEVTWGRTGLTDEGWDELVKRVDLSEELLPYQRLNAGDAMIHFKETGDIPTFGEIALIERALGKSVADALRKAKGLPARAWQEFWELINLPRAILASFDLSAPLRQGGLLLPGHPLEWAKNIRPMIRAFADEKFAREWYKRLTTGTAASRREAAGLFVSEFGQDALTLAREEMYITKWASKFPFLRHSERAYAMYLNGLRADIFDNVVRGWDDLVKAGKWTPEELLTRERQLAGFLNAASGRGTLGPLKNYGQILSGLWFSPRLTISRVEAPIRVAASLGTPGVRKELAKDLVGFVATGVGILSLLKLSGAADVELDPRSSDFGKIKLGPTRIDFWAGYQPIVRYTAQFIKGERKTIGTGEFFPADRNEIVLRFLQSKLSPQAGAVVDLWRGETYMGEQMAGTMDVGQREAWNRLVPLFIQDMVEAGKMEGWPGMLKVAPAGLGMGAMTFETPGEKIIRVSEEEAGVKWTEQGAIERMRLEERYPEIGKARTEQLEAAGKWGKPEALESRQADADFEAQFKGILSDPNATYQQATSVYRNYLQQRATANQTRWADSPERDPRSDLERRTDAYDAIEYPTYGTPEEKDAYFDKRAAALAADPEVARAVKDRQLFRFKDPTVRSFIQRYQSAIDVRNEYYQIPRYQGLSVEEGREVQRLVNEAQAMVELGQAPNRKAALMMMYQQGRTQDFRLVMVAMNADRLRNPERRAFRQAHPEAFEMFEPVPMEALQGITV